MTPGGFCLASVFLRQHEGENAGCFLIIGRVFAAEFHGRIVVIDLPEDFAAVVDEGPEVVLTVKIVILGEVVESANLPQDDMLLLGGQRRETAGEEDAAAGARRAKAVVEVTDAGNLIEAK